MLITSSRRRQWVPPVHARVNWSHPLALSLNDLWLPYGPAGRNIARNAEPYVTGTVESTATKWGLALEWDAGSYVSIPSHGQDLSFYDGLIQPWTVRMLFRPITWAATLSAVICKDTSGTDSDFGFAVDGSSNGDASNWRQANRNSGANINTNFVAGGHYDMLWRNDGTTAITWFNAAAPISTPVNAGGTSGAPTAVDLSIGHSADTAIADTAMAVSLVQTWRRSLSNAEVAWLYEDPWAMCDW
jgi:hypothetical protein